MVSQVGGLMVKLPTWLTPPAVEGRAVADRLKQCGGGHPSDTAREEPGHLATPTRGQGATGR